MIPNCNKLLFLIAIVLLMNGCNDEIQIPKLTCTQPDLKVNKTVDDIRVFTSVVPTQYVYDDIIEAYVVSSDESGNFFKTISFQTLATSTVPAVGFSVGADASNLYIDYRIGNKVYLKMKNQFTDFYYGGMRIGSLYVNSYGEATVGRISQNDYKNVLYASCATIDENKLTEHLTIAQALDDSKINTLIELSGVQFSEDAIGRHYFEEANNIGGATNWNLKDKTGNQIIFRTSSYADFAANLIPQGSGTVKGVLTKYGTDYQLIARSEEDIVMNGSRSVPFFFEDFQTVTDKATISLPGWTNIVEKGKLFWKGVVYSGNGYAEYAISGTKVVANVGWLISPVINMDQYQKEVLTFRAAQHHLDVDSPLNSLQVLVSTNFDGLNVAKATWIPLTAKLPNQATPWYQFVGSGAIDLSKYAGNIRIAFKYTGSGKDLALDGAFQIDDVQIYGEK